MPDTLLYVSDRGRLARRDGRRSLELSAAESGLRHVTVLQDFRRRQWERRKITEDREKEREKQRQRDVETQPPRCKEADRRWSHKTCQNA